MTEEEKWLYTIILSTLEEIAGDAGLWLFLEQFNIYREGDSQKC